MGVFYSYVRCPLSMEKIIRVGVTTYTLKTPHEQLLSLVFVQQFREYDRDRTHSGAVFERTQDYVINVFLSPRIKKNVQ